MPSPVTSKPLSLQYLKIFLMVSVSLYISIPPFSGLACHGLKGRFRLPVSNQVIKHEQYASPLIQGSFQSTCLSSFVSIFFPFPCIADVVGFAVNQYDFTIFIPPYNVLFHILIPQRACRKAITGSRCRLTMVLYFFASLINQRRLSSAVPSSSLFSLEFTLSQAAKGVRSHLPAILQDILFLEFLSSDCQFSLSLQVFLQMCTSGLDH